MNEAENQMQNDHADIVPPKPAQSIADHEAKVRELATNLDHQLKYDKDAREFVNSVVLVKHTGEFHRKDYIAFGLLTRCLQTHEAIETLIRASLVDDAWVLIRALVEHAVNCGYMLRVADAQTADDFAGYQDYKLYLELQDLKATDEALLRQAVTAENEEELRKKYEGVRARFDNKRGDKWCADDRLYVRANKLDATMKEGGKEHHDFLWLVNSVWRYGSSFTHGSADALTHQMKETEEGVEFRRKYTNEEAAKALNSSTLALYLLFPIIDERLGGKNQEGFKKHFSAWIG
jgi:hypothetical protein